MSFVRFGVNRVLFLIFRGTGILGGLFWFTLVMKCLYRRKVVNQVYGNPERFFSIQVLNLISSKLVTARKVRWWVSQRRKKFIRYYEQEHTILANVLPTKCSPFHQFSFQSLEKVVGDLTHLDSNEGFCDWTTVLYQYTILLLKEDRLMLGVYKNHIQLMLQSNIEVIHSIVRAGTSDYPIRLDPIWLDPIFVQSLVQK